MPFPTRRFLLPPSYSGNSSGNHLTGTASGPVRIPPSWIPIPPPSGAPGNTNNGPAAFVPPGNPVNPIPAWIPRALAAGGAAAAAAWQALQNYFNRPQQQQTIQQYPQNNGSYNVLVCFNNFIKTNEKCIQIKNIRAPITNVKWERILTTNPNSLRVTVTGTNANGNPYTESEKLPINNAFSPNPSDHISTTFTPANSYTPPFNPQPVNRNVGQPFQNPWRNQQLPPGYPNNTQPPQGTSPAIPFRGPAPRRRGRAGPVSRPQAPPVNQLPNVNTPPPPTNPGGGGGGLPPNPFSNLPNPFSQLPNLFPNNRNNPPLTPAQTGLGVPLPNLPNSNSNSPFTPSPPPPNAPQLPLQVRFPNNNSPNNSNNSTPSNSPFTQIPIPSFNPNQSGSNPNFTPGNIINLPSTTPTATPTTTPANTPTGSPSTRITYRSPTSSNVPSNVPSNRPSNTRSSSISRAGTRFTIPPNFVVSTSPATNTRNGTIAPPPTTTNNPTPTTSTTSTTSTTTNTNQNPIAPANPNLTTATGVGIATGVGVATGVGTQLNAPSQPAPNVPTTTNPVTNTPNNTNVPTRTPNNPPLTQPLPSTQRLIRAANQGQLVPTGSGSIPTRNNNPCSQITRNPIQRIFPRPISSQNNPTPVIVNNCMDCCDEVRKILQKVKRIEEDLYAEIKVSRDYKTCNERETFKVEHDGELIKIISEMFGAIHDHQNFFHKKEFCETDFVAAVPDYWQHKIGADRPQMVVQFAEKLANGKLGIPNKPISIPHLKYNSIARWDDKKAPISDYTRGNWEAIATMADNSKIIIHSSTKKEADKILNEALGLVLAKFSNDAKIKIGERTKTPIKKVKVYPKLAKLFTKGQRDLKPDEIVYFKKPATTTTSSSSRTSSSTNR